MVRRIERYDVIPYAFPPPAHYYYTAKIIYKRKKYFIKYKDVDSYNKQVDLLIRRIIPHYQNETVDINKLNVVDISRKRYGKVTFRDKEYKSPYV